jgi:hypothetical protein
VWCSWRHVKKSEERGEDHSNGSGEAKEKEMEMEKEPNDKKNMAGCGAGGQPVCGGKQMIGVRLLLVPVPVPVDTVVVEDSKASCCLACWVTAPDTEL